MKHLERTQAGGRPWKGAAPILMFLIFMITAGAATAEPLKVAVAADDHAAAHGATRGYIHVLPRKDAAPGAQASPNALTRYQDLIYHGGPVVTAAQIHNIYVNAPSTTWGDPARFTTDYGASNMIHVLDLYMPAGVKASNRYVTGVAVSATIPVPTQPLQDPGDIAPIVHAAAVSVGGTGYGHIYHVFLPPSYAICAPITGGCYNAPPFIFCAYHSSYDFPDIGHVLYTVEPYQDVPGCMISGSSPNGVLTDSTDSVLLHEESEEITDTDGDAWFDRLGYEVADKCESFSATVSMNLHSYRVQELYSNRIHGCSTGP